MTFGELHDLLDFELQFLWDDAVEKDRVLNRAVLERLADWHKAFERDEQVRAYLHGLTGTPVIVDGGRATAQELGDPFRVLAVEARWNEEGVWTPCAAGRIDQLSRMAHYWMFAPTEEQPYYRQHRLPGGGRVWDVVGPSAPYQMRVTPLLAPQRIEGASRPEADWSDFPPDAEQAILQTAVRYALGRYGDSRYTAQVQVDERSST